MKIDSKSFQSVSAPFNRTGFCFNARSISDFSLVINVGALPKLNFPNKCQMHLATITALKSQLKRVAVEFDQQHRVSLLNFEFSDYFIFLSNNGPLMAL